jgi:hypothetical protein
MDLLATTLQLFDAQANLCDPGLGNRDRGPGDL